MARGVSVFFPTYFGSRASGRVYVRVFGVGLFEHEGATLRMRERARCGGARSLSKFKFVKMLLRSRPVVSVAFVGISRPSSTQANKF